MIIKKMSLYNFRQFKEKENIVFSTDDHSNITLILGVNTSGKTTILQAFLWCFYNKANFKTGDELYNKQNAIEMKNGDTKPVKVIVELEHGGVNYIISREHLCEKVNDEVKLVGQSFLKVFYMNKKGETGNVDPTEAENVIKQILPNDLAEYFFYDTERFGNITEKKDVTGAVKGLLGLTVLENAIKHLGRRTQSTTVIGRFYNELNHDGNKKLKQINEEVNKSELKISQLNERLKSTDNEISIYEEKIKSKESQLRELKTSMNIQKEIDRKKELYKLKEKEYKDAKSEYQKIFQEGSLSLIMSPLKEKALTFLTETEIKDEGIRDMNSNSIQDIIDRGYCVCGTTIKKDSREYLSLQRSLEFLPPQSLGNMIKNYLNKLEIITRNPNFINYLKDKQKELSRIKMELPKIERQIEHLSRNLKQIGEAKELQSRVESETETLKRLRVVRDNLVSEIGVEESKMEKFKTESNKLTKINENNIEIYHLLRYAEEIATWFGEDYNIRNQEITDKLEQKVNYYFSQIYHGKRFVKIDPNYKVTLYSSENNQNIKTDESAGLETVKNFSFIAGLVDLAKEKLEGSKRNEGNESIKFNENEDYPLVLDAPFSNVDEEHVINISKVLPDVAGQLILVVMEKDWNYAAEKLKNKVGKTFYLNKLSEIHTKIEGV